MHELTEKILKNKWSDWDYADKIITDWLEEKVDQLAFSLNHPSLEDHVVIEKILGLGPEKADGAFCIDKSKPEPQRKAEVVISKQLPDPSLCQHNCTHLYERGFYKGCCLHCGKSRIACEPRPEKSQDTIKLLMPEHAAYYKTEQIIDKLNEVIRAVNGSGGK